MKVICNDWATALTVANYLVHEPKATLYIEQEGKRIVASSRGTMLSKLHTHPQRTSSGSGRYVVTDKPTGDYVVAIKQKEHLNG